MTSSMGQLVLFGQEVQNSLIAVYLARDIESFFRPAP